MKNKEVLDEKCLNCGATIHYKPLLDKFRCDYCRSEFTLEDIKKYKEKHHQEVNLNEKSKLEEVDAYYCNNCGASIITLNNTSSTKCVYCKSNAIIKNRLTGLFKPDSLILFQKTKEDAIDAFKKICQGRPLLPKDFNNINNIKEMEGLYVPFWLYDLKNDCYLQADCTRIKTWSDSNYIYTKTSFYKVERGGSLSFYNVPNDAATRFDDEIMNAIEPFNFNNLKKFETSYLAGFLAEKYDEEKNKVFAKVQKRIENDSTNYLRGQITSYQTVNVLDNKNLVSKEKIKYVLLPVWVLNIKYQDKVYHFAMNGETGKLVGEIPVDKKKMFLTIILTFLLSFGLILVFFLIGGYKF